MQFFNKLKKTNTNSAQGTIEYLVILAIVVVISLVIVGLFTNMFSSSSQEITTSSSNLGNITSGGISVVEAVIDIEGDSLIRVSNNSSDVITLTKISVGGVDNNFSEQLVGLDSKVFSLSSLNSNCPCEDGQKKVKCEFRIEYSTSGGLVAKTDYKTINVDCVTDSIPVNSNIVVVSSEVSAYFGEPVCSTSPAKFALGASGSATANGVFVDSLGNIYVAGHTASSLDFGNGVTISNRGAVDFFVVKYDSSGVALWAKNSESGAGTSNDYAYNVVVDSSGNVYVSGNFGTSLKFSSDINLTSRGGADFFVVKYNSSGVAQWAKNPAIGTSTSNDFADALVLDSTDNLYLGGSFSSTSIGFGNGLVLTNSGNDDFFIVKYDSSGVAQWAKNPSSGTGTGWDYMKSISTDSSGNVYLAGYSLSSSLGFGDGVSVNLSGVNFFVAKYNSSGVAQWAKAPIEQANSHGEAMFSDSSGNVYVSGYFNQEYVLNFGNGVTLTNRGGVDGMGDFFVVKYDSTGVAQWAKNPAINSGLYEDISISISADDSGNVYVSGYSWSFVDFGNDIKFYPKNDLPLSDNFFGGLYNFFVVKYDSSGVALWVKSPAPGEGYSSQIPNSTFVDSLGNIYVAGSNLGSHLGFGNGVSLDGASFFVVKYGLSSETFCVERGVTGVSECNLGTECASGYCNTLGHVCSLGVSAVDYCAQGSDCNIGYCNTNAWPPICSNGITGVDGCALGSDCVSGYCNTMDYLCSSGITGVASCNIGSDCVDGYCNTLNYLCSNGSFGSTCDQDSDCASGSCNYGNSTCN